ncbi:Dps family protein [Amnibacterium endophyticum]|uniref:Dps family protein n=1 Tax=Amnibacterium endophyticum TaxID=2109337 RepID=A0ABW4LK26_9MICO
MTDLKAAAPAEPVIDQTQASAEDINGSQQYLAPIVWDLQALQLATKQAHWHVRGDNFIAVHKLLDKITDHVREFADLAAERTVALGLPVDARPQTVAAKTTLPVMQDGFQNYGPMIEQVVAQMDAAVVTVRKAVKGLDDIDLNSQDVAIEIERGLVEDRWFLAAHLATDN